MLRAYKGIRPSLGPRAWVDPSAQVIGDVALGEDASVWMTSVVRGDVNRIRIGARTNVQDACVLHVTAQHPTTLAEDVTVGHSVTLHGCTIERLCLIGIGAIVLNGAVVGEESIVAAGALVPEGMVIPARSVVMGSPAKVRRSVTEEERAGLRRYAENYVRYKDEYRSAEEGA
jgi:carbonic anhydrase/acetyltransferase-like protein (isoleucine patch superfamily)